MFEKEAEEYLKAQCKKRKEEYVIRMPEIYIADIPQAYQDGAEFGYNKANEWHYVKDELPTEDDVYLIYTTRGVLLGHYEQGGADGETDFSGVPYSDFTEYPSERLFTEDEIIAWKEIVPPNIMEV